MAWQKIQQNRIYFDDPMLLLRRQPSLGESTAGLQAAAEHRK